MKFKFRGKDIETGKFVYGNFYQIGDHTVIIEICIDCAGSHYPKYITVDHDSVALFVGCDKNGKEIYSDDKVRIKDFLLHAFEHIEKAEKVFNIGDIGKTFDKVELIEESGKNDK